MRSMQIRVTLSPTMKADLLHAKKASNAAKSESDMLLELIQRGLASLEHGKIHSESLEGTKWARHG